MLKRAVFNIQHLNSNREIEIQSLFFAKPANCPSPLSRQFSIYILFFLWSPSFKNWWTPIILTFFIFNPTYFLKVTKFLVQICQFKFLVMAEFSLFFYVKTAIPSSSCSKKSPPLFWQPRSKNWYPVRPPFWEFGRRLNPQDKGSVHHVSRSLLKNI